MQELIKIIEENAMKEFAAFREVEIAKKKENIFYDCHKISFFCELHEFLTYESDYLISQFEERELKIVAKTGFGFIEDLYGYYLDTENASISNYEATGDLIRWYCNEYEDLYLGGTNE